MSAPIDNVLYSASEYRTAPARHAAAVTPSDTTTLTTVARSLYIGTAGNISLLTADGDTVTFTSVPVGILPVMVQRVNSTLTTAQNIVALW